MVNFNQFLKQAQSMHKKMQEAQEQIANARYTGKAGGGLVEITITGRSEVEKVSVDESLLKAEEKEMLEDLIKVAFNDAKQKCDENSQNSLSGALNGINLPLGFKMPF
ncbi:MAG: YbaB/EbfC family nucleoid-associated protein [Rickettsia endosymbiont of Ixodes persulcatus]|nr:YbaB/EbfC family nucleoid-associated protein [Rickettsia endosymbiont of Ixodes persulcatus]MCZ6903618.1 YbaB/EbfC family nucleoid-associated protein [Rickettsia endosymbiont of Ixodes persulcatus]MCZ6908546.1 YbaB/EbfC family nucleoid-associated protein [Rickettsia endosymbiont of Ixodes persulcatus]MCZ6910226.1 YbaB/EbfC family nucleoid-associated protein [Rickettsia endosymbiont of Ixodes persulcatus]MCZ6913456.1 YbaB/EbfC family nucleoid-associated protein [Rickettsia endosymbiont of Ixo